MSTPVFDRPPRDLAELREQAGVYSGTRRRLPRPLGFDWARRLCERLDPNRPAWANTVATAGIYGTVVALYGLYAVTLMVAGVAMLAFWPIVLVIALLTGGDSYRLRRQRIARQRHEELITAIRDQRRTDTR